MPQPILSVREMSASDIPLIIQYWLSATPAYLQGMGVDLSKMPAKEQWEAMLNTQLTQDYDQKASYCIILEIDGKAIGHCNVNKIEYGKEAYMHLHIWDVTNRKRGWGARLVRMAIPCFFNNLQLKKLCCEPWALNPAPNNTLKKIGFRFVKRYTTTPGYLNFEQEVNLWELEAEFLTDFA
ncbi:MAG: GNAT family protein [Saprospiraceae bacterium]|nr:GNAT family protein [Saprospiraceae bacterium]